MEAVWRLNPAGLNTAPSIFWDVEGSIKTVTCIFSCSPSAFATVTFISLFSVAHPNLNHVWLMSGRHRRLFREAAADHRRKWRQLQRAPLQRLEEQQRHADEAAQEGPGRAGRAEVESGRDDEGVCAWQLAIGGKRRRGPDAFTRCWFLVPLEALVNSRFLRVNFTA